LARSSNKKIPQDLPPIPDKLYFTIGEASALCFVKPYVLRYWEQEFPQLNPTKRRGKRRYYQRNEIILIRRIKNLLYEQGYTIEGARNKLSGEDTTNLIENDPKLTNLLKNVVSKLALILAELERG